MAEAEDDNYSMTVFQTQQKSNSDLDAHWRKYLGAEFPNFDPEKWEGEMPTVSEFIARRGTPEIRVTSLVDNPVGENSKPSNPKDAIGSDKLPLHLWPMTATALGCLGMLDGALKYGRSNFRAIGVRNTIYIDAAMRHMAAYLEGEDEDPDSGLDHRAHALACLAIIVDAEAAGKLNDDRNVRGGWRAWVNKLTPYVPLLKAKHADKSPKHYTITDNEDLFDD